MDGQKIRTHIKTLALNDVSSSARLLSTSVVVVTYFMPALIGVWVGLGQPLIAERWWAFFLPLGAFVVIQSVLGWPLIRRDHGSIQQAFLLADEISHECNRALAENAQLRHDIEYMALLDEAVYSWNNMQREYRQLGLYNPDDLQEAFDEVMKPVLQARDKLFGLGADELWNFAIYIHEPDHDRLVPLWRKHHPELPANGMGRSWTLGEGHVGVTFVRNEALITEDATDSGVATLVAANEGNRRSYDGELYRSFSSIPIGFPDGGARPFGVLVATSNRAGRYQRANSIILRHAALAIAGVIEDAAKNPLESTK